MRRIRGRETCFGNRSFSPVYVFNYLHAIFNRVKNKTKQKTPTATKEPQLSGQTEALLGFTQQRNQPPHHGLCPPSDSPPLAYRIGILPVFSNPEPGSLIIGCEG